MKVITLTKLGEFLTICKGLFASQDATLGNDTNIETYVLNVDYKNTLDFDTSEEALGGSPNCGYAMVGYTTVA